MIKITKITKVNKLCGRRRCDRHGIPPLTCKTSRGLYTHAPTAYSLKFVGDTFSVSVLNIVGLVVSCRF